MKGNVERRREEEGAGRRGPGEEAGETHHGVEGPRGQLTPLLGVPRLLPAAPCVLQESRLRLAPGLGRGQLVLLTLTQEHPGSRPGSQSPGTEPLPQPGPARTHLPLWPNRRKRTQRTMQVTPTWMPTTTLVVEVAPTSCFRQSQGGLRAAGRSTG